MQLVRKSQQKKGNAKWQKKKEKKKFSSKGEKKVNGCGSLQDQKSHQVRKHEKTERQDFRKKVKTFSQTR